MLVTYSGIISVLLSLMSFILYVKKRNLSHIIAFSNLFITIYAVVDLYAHYHSPLNQMKLWNINILSSIIIVPYLISLLYVMIQQLLKLTR